MKEKLFSFLFALLIVTVFISGCFEEEKKELSFNQIRNNFLNKIKNVDSYKYRISGSSIQTVVNESGSDIVEMQSISNGSVDILNNNLKFEKDYLDTGKNNQMKIYLLDGFSYTFIADDWNLSWDIKDISSLDFSNYWGLYSYLESFVEEMKNPQENTTFERLDDEKIEDKSYYVLQSVYKYNFSGTGQDDYSYYEIGIKFWIEKNDFLLYKIQSTSKSDSKEFFAMDSNQEIEHSENQYIFYDYNIPFTIELPTYKSKTIYVDDSGGKDFKSIQDAIDFANPEDVIYVYSGTYKESIVINKSISLIGGNKFNTIIKSSLIYKNLLYVYADYVTVLGFTFENNHINNYAIKINSTHSSIKNNIIKETREGKGLILENSNYNIISGNTIDINDEGIYLIYSDDNTISENFITRCSIGINLVYSNNTNIYSNSIVENYGNDIKLDHSNKNIISGNTISQSYHGIFLTYSSSNTIFENTFNDNQYGMEFTQFSDNNINYHNNFIDNNRQNSRDSRNNTWYSTTLKEGNYWDDYQGTDANGDGIGDTPYNIIGGDNQDMYPLINPLDI